MNLKDRVKNPYHIEYGGSRTSYGDVFDEAISACQKVVEEERKRLFEKIEMFALEFPRFTIEDLLNGEWWQSIKAEFGEVNHEQGK